MCVAEAVEVLHGILFAQDMGFKKIIVESDLRTVIQKLKTHSEDYSALRPIT